MTDRDKVIKGLECCTAELGINQHRDDFCTVCPYKDKAPENWYCFYITDLMRDALALLKVQEAVKPTIGGDADGPCKNWWYQCGKCKEAIDYHDKYCKNCGRAVKWE